MRYLDVAEFTAVTPLSLLVSLKLTFPIVGFKMFFPAPTLELKPLKFSNGI
jgi:hypothetical protein